MSDSVRPHRRQPTRLPHPWDSPGKNTRVGCHFLLQCMKVKSESEVTQSCPVSNSSRPHGLQPTRLLCPWEFQARVLEWGAITFSITFLSFLDYLDPRLHKVLTSFMKSQFLIYFFIGSFWDPPILNSHDTLLSRLMLKTL